MAEFKAIHKLSLSPCHIQDIIPQNLPKPSSIKMENAAHNHTKLASSSIGNIFAFIASRNGDKTAVTGKCTSYTYSELDGMARALGMQLIQRGLGYEEHIGILATHGSHQVIAQLAIIYMGGTCVPLDPDRPESDTQTQLQVAGVRNIVVDDAFQPRLISVLTFSSPRAPLAPQRLLKS